MNATRITKTYGIDNGTMVVVVVTPKDGLPVELRFYAEGRKPLEFCGACWADGEGEPCEYAAASSHPVHKAARAAALRWARRAA